MSVNDEHLELDPETRAALDNPEATPRENEPEAKETPAADPAAIATPEPPAKTDPNPAATAGDVRALSEQISETLDLMREEVIRVTHEPFSAEELAEMSGLQGIRDRVLAASGSKNPTVRDFIRISGRGRVHNAIVGGPKEVADQLEQWFAAPACDGFVLSMPVEPRSLRDFVELVVPELQRRGLAKKKYAGPTLRENLNG